MMHHGKDKAMKTIYVCAQSGNDAWSGWLPEPDRTQTDGPLRTLAAAQIAVRRQRRVGPRTESLEVVLRGGVHTLSQPLRFEAADSGFGRQDEAHGRTWPVVWRAAAGEDVIVSAGRRVCGWQPATLNGHAVWFADVPWADGEAGFTRQLWIDGKRRPRARLPKTGSWTVAEAPDAVYAGGFSKTLANGARRFGFRPGEISGDWSNLQSVEVRFRGLWVSPVARLLGVDEKTATALLDRDTGWRLAYAPGDGLDYHVENVLEGLTEPGEWCLDPVVRRIWYRPLPGETPDGVRAVAGGLDRLLELRGASWLRFENVRFAHAEWRPGPTEPVAEQSSVGVSAAIRVGAKCQGIVFEGCRIEHVGGYGLECAEGATDVAFRNGAIRDLGAGGVKIWDGCRRCVLEDSEIADGGHLWVSGAGVVIGKASGNAVMRCHIHDFFYTAVSVGWTWGYAEGDAYGNVIEWNHIHDIGKGMLSDMGGVYLLGNALGTRVRHNRIHDIRSLRYGGWAIYPDEGSSDLLIENNLCYNTDREIFHQHYGRNNLVRNNIFAYGGEAVLAYTRMEEHTGVTFERNIFVARGTPMARGVSAERWRRDKTRFSNNLYWREDGPVWFDAGSLSLATQPFAGAYAGEAGRFRPLPEDGVTIAALSAPGMMEGAVTDAGSFRFERNGARLSLTGRFRGAIAPGKGTGAVWTRPRIEVFLKPFPDSAAMVQLGVAADGEGALVWHGCDIAEALNWKARTEADAQGWTATIEVSLDAVESAIRAACGIAAERGAQWGALAGVTLPAARSDFAAWQAHCGDATGIVADPGFANPEAGDFTLPPDSPAFRIGFRPFDCPGLDYPGGQAGDSVVTGLIPLGEREES